MTIDKGSVLLHAALLAFFASALLISFAVTPEDLESGRVVLSPACTFHRVTGWDCPTCGLTRAFSALSHGQIGRAFDYNRGSLIVYLVFWTAAIFLTHSLAQIVRRKS